MGFFPLHSTLCGIIKGATIKTKAEKRKWWNKINAEQQNDFTDKKVEDKKRRKKRHK